MDECGRAAEVVTMKRTHAASGASALAVLGFALGASLASADPPGGFVPGSTVGPGDHVPICHAIGNGGYEAIAPSAQSASTHRRYPTRSQPAT